MTFNQKITSLHLDVLKEIETLVLRMPRQHFPIYLGKNRYACSKSRNGIL